jgi:hypothetical protein
VIPEIDIWRVANLVFKHYGSESTTAAKPRRKALDAPMSLRAVANPWGVLRQCAIAEC